MGEIAGAAPPGDSSEANPTLQGNPLILDPSIETTPPPGQPINEFGVGSAAEYEGLGPVAPGQTLIVYHPFSGQPPEIVDTAHLAWTREPDICPPSEEPYAPFKTRADFEQAEIFIRHNCADTMINDQLRLNQEVSQAREQDTHAMKNAREMHKILAQAGQYQDISSVNLLYLLKSFHDAYVEVQFRSVDISVPYSHGVKSEDRTYAISFRPAMEAILDVIEDPDLWPSFTFYPERHYTLNPQTKELMRVWTDIHTGDDWWELQVCFTMTKWQD